MHRREYEADVIVVGFGAAGGCAAIEAHDSGAEVILLEKQPEDSALLEHAHERRRLSQPGPGRRFRGAQGLREGDVQRREPAAQARRRAARIRRRARRALGASTRRRTRRSCAASIRTSRRSVCANAAVPRVSRRGGVGLRRGESTYTGTYDEATRLPAARRTRPSRRSNRAKRSTPAC